MNEEQRKLGVAALGEAVMNITQALLMIQTAKNVGMIIPDDLEYNLIGIRDQVYETRRLQQ